VCYAEVWNDPAALSVGILTDWGLSRLLRGEVPEGEEAFVAAGTNCVESIDVHLRALRFHFIVRCDAPSVCPIVYSTNFASL
jgi:hypothetical protein